MAILTIKRLLILMALSTSMLAHAQPASHVAWTPETLNLVKQGNAEKGKQLATTCQSCHGDKGQGLKAEVQDDETIPAVPALAGQLATYTFKQLRDYAVGDRANDTMTNIAKNLSEQDTADLAAWFSTLPRAASTTSKTNLDRAEKMVNLGDGKRILPPCFTCHGNNGQGEKMDIPALAGQQADYFASTLLAYKKGERHNDIYSRMRLIAQQLSEAEIRELADYYQQYK
ncbi:c-type cytochrome [Methylosoma difficile]